MPRAVTVCLPSNFRSLAQAADGRHSAQHRSAVKPPGHLLVLGALVQGDADLAPDDVGLQQVPARCSDLLS